MALHRTRNECLIHSERIGNTTNPELDWKKFTPVLTYHHA